MHFGKDVTPDSKYMTHLQWSLTVSWSEGSLLWRVITPKCHCSEGSYCPEKSKLRMRVIYNPNHNPNLNSNPNPNPNNGAIWPFGAMTLRSKTLRNNDPYALFGVMTLWSNDMSPLQQHWLLVSQPPLAPITLISFASISLISTSRYWLVQKFK